MADMTPTKNPMPEQAPLVRNKNFLEVATGYTADLAMAEAKRCLHCKNKPCVVGCPVRVNIPEFIEKVAQGDFEEAYSIITSTSSLPAVCGRVCTDQAARDRDARRGALAGDAGIGRQAKRAAGLDGR